MEDSTKSLAEKLGAIATNSPKDLDQLKSMSEEDMRMAENNGIGPEITGTNDCVTQGPGNTAISDGSDGMETKPGGTIVSFERLMRDFSNHQDDEGKFQLLNKSKCYLRKLGDYSIQLFENGELLGVMFPGDKLDLDFGAQTAKVINYLIKEDNATLTFGQKAVKATFDPSGDPRVVKAKQLIADAIDLLEEVHQEKTDNGAASSTWFRNVFRTEAFNQLVNASSSLVKYLTWQD